MSATESQRDTIVHEPPVPSPRKRDVARVRTTEILGSRAWRARELNRKHNELLRLAHTIDPEVIHTLPLHPVAFDTTRRVIQTLETLTYGIELSSQPVTDANINETTRRVYDGDPPCFAYVKSSFGEMCFDAKGNIHAFDHVQAKRVPTGQVFPASEMNYISTLFKPDTRAHITWHLSRKYDIPEDDPSFSSETTLLAPRLGVEAGSGTVREYAASRIDALLGFHTVPLTVLRVESVPGQIDSLLSVQEAVHSTHAEAPSRPLYIQETNILYTQDPSMWASAFDERFDKYHADIAHTVSRNEETDREPAQSLMRIACLDYLIGNMDRHYGNILFDPTSKTFHAIDHGLSFGTARHIPMVHSDHVTTFGLRSFPLEIVTAHPSLKLDERALDQLRAFVEDLKTDTAIQKTIERLFTMLFPDPRVAAVEQKHFLMRLNLLIEYGRPPDEVQWEIHFIYKQSRMNLRYQVTRTVSHSDVLPA